jgi:hypothetical protein
MGFENDLGNSLRVFPSLEYISEVSENSLRVPERNDPFPKIGNRSRFPGKLLSETLSRFSVLCEPI